VVSQFFSDVLWWLGGFFLRCFGVFSAFDGAWFAAIGFFRFFGGDSGLMSYHGWSSHLLN
jgi:hypothetical protein